ncbi:MAG: Crp/Fnr family transcriptional regulator [Synechococcaceae cyanobacterium]|nr:Crp/Fnr family transcriptional regulator [Synechococcaceae cyanobacterium]
MPSPSPGAIDTMQALARNHPIRDLRAGDIVFRSGDPGDTMFGVLEGSIRLHWDGDESSETFGPGTCFGMGALVDPQHRRHGTATALSDGRIIALDRDHFLFAVQELPMFGLEMLHVLEERLRALKTGRRRGELP